MNTVILWHRILGLIFDPLFNRREKNRLQQSFKYPVVAANDRDSFRFYENGRWVTLEAELMCGELDRQIYRGRPLRWNDSAEILTPEEEDRIFRKLCEHFDQRKVRWKFYEVSSGV
jgi:hypothetical protein